MRYFSERKRGKWGRAKHFRRMKRRKDDESHWLDIGRKKQNMVGPINNVIFVKGNLHQTHLFACSLRSTKLSFSSSPNLS